MNEQNKIVAFGLSMPSICPALNGTRGKLNLRTIIRILHCVNHPKIMELLIIGVKDEYKTSGLPFVIFSEIMQIVKMKKIEFAESNAQLLTNTQIHKLFEHFNPNYIRERIALCKEI